MNKGTTVGQFVITKVGRPGNPKATNPPAPVRNTNASVKKQREQGGDVKEKNMKVKTLKINWKTPDNFRLLKAVVGVSLCRDKGHITMLTDINVPERTLRRIAPTFNGLLKKYVKLEDVTVGIGYPTQYDGRRLFSLIYRDFLKYRYYNGEG